MENKPVTIMEIGVFGESLIISGLEISEDEWKFGADADSSFLQALEKDQEQLFPSKPAIDIKYNWDEMLNVIKQNHKNWITYHPVIVHPKFGRKVWEAVLEESKYIDSIAINSWMKNIKKWAELCFKSDQRES